MYSAQNKARELDGHVVVVCSLARINIGRALVGSNNAKELEVNELEVQPVPNCIIGLEDSQRNFGKVWTCKQNMV